MDGTAEGFGRELAFGGFTDQKVLLDLLKTRMSSSVTMVKNQKLHSEVDKKRKSISSAEDPSASSTSKKTKPDVEVIECSVVSDIDA